MFDVLLVNQEPDKLNTNYKC